MKFSKKFLRNFWFSFSLLSCCQFYFSAPGYSMMFSCGEILEGEFFETDHLFIRPAVSGDKYFIRRHFSDPIMNGVPGTPLRRHEKRKIGTSLAQGNNAMTTGSVTLAFMILEKSSEHPVGVVTFKQLAGTEDGIIGFSINRSYWSRGYMTEALKVLIHTFYHKLRFWQPQYIFAVVHHGNVGSRRVLEKLGFQRLDRWRHALIDPTGSAITADDLVNPEYDVFATESGGFGVHYDLPTPLNP